MLSFKERQQLRNLAERDEDLPANPGDLRVWWIPQIPGKPFIKRVANLDEAALLLDTLAQYDAFQLIHRIKPDYANAGGLSVFENDAWSDWESEDGEDFDEWRRQQAEQPT